MEDKIIIGFTGPIASGKEVAKRYIETKYGGSNFKFSSILRNILSSIEVEQNRDNMMSLSTFLRQTYGEDILAKAIAKSVKEAKGGVIVIDGIRRLADIAYLREVPGFTLIAIDAKNEVRYSRSVKRNENPGDAQKSLEEFLADHYKETELTIPEVMSQADFTINNDGSFEDLYVQIENVISKIKNK